MRSPRAPSENRRGYRSPASSGPAEVNHVDGSMREVERREEVAAMAKREVYVCDFELLDRGERVVALPVGIDGVTEGYDYTDAIRMSADWLRETALDFLMRGEAWPELPLGTEPSSGGRMVTIAVEVGLDEVPSVTAAEAAVMLGVSTARVAQLCKAGLLDSWKVGRTRMVSLESVETRAGEKAGPGRPRKEKASA